MRTTFKWAAAATLLASSALALSGESLEGRWDAQLVRKDTVIPFRLDLAGEGTQLQATLYDGFRPYEKTTAGSFKDGKLLLDIEHYQTKINATLKDGQLVGDVIAQNRGNRSEYSFVAIRHDAKADARAAAVVAPAVAGTWEIPLPAPSSKGEKAFRLYVDQRGSEVAASILRVDGDTGSYSGTYRDGKWVLSHFDGSRPGVIEITAGNDGTLSIRQRVDRPQAPTGNSYETAPDGRYAQTLTAYRPAVARAKGFAEPANYLTHTTARDPSEKFAFSFPDLDGKTRTQDDPYFKDQVVLAIVTGTWCPNCHDEAQYLVQLDKQYRDRGLRIVALTFEEVEQQDSLSRARAFVKQYGVKYPYLLAGAPEEMWEKVPQLLNLNTWPATVFVGRDGTVRAVHAGFASPASGEFHAQLKKEFSERIEQLLAEKAPVDKRLSALAP